jgi:hypothetical protein
MRNDLIQTSCLVLGWMIPLSTSDSTLSKSPHRDTLLENPIKNLKSKCEGVKPYMFILMIIPISCETVNEFIVRMFVGCFDQY